MKNLFKTNSRKVNKLRMCARGMDDSNRRLLIRGETGGKRIEMPKETILFFDISSNHPKDTNVAFTCTRVYFLPICHPWR